ncbi:DUF3141 domain-containing protein [Noviherbaspirillum sp. CPCC 100848]|uniref:DUF3141 domain-containing protein n=1 Tax=Noviherbaspirillum album TaxID=3080276 RepID=A0ABU6J3K2_9BURK|nr:DUF3141 domain-containing protein [Noviherbaspirillum sp. CPCC 100848]MEC4718093.1 DUF3141 domain-containing protein [Noviherbaspirillum sp. CPCC 100848]
MRTTSNKKRLSPVAKPTLDRQDVLPASPKADASSIPAVAVTNLSSSLPVASTSLIQDASQYQLDFFQRSIMFFDTLRERADNMFAHESAGMPPPLDFDYETILDARHFDTPANYALLRITRCRDHFAKEYVGEEKPPVIIIDPRAGHGPGIGGSKHDSEVGISLHEGHPTYFVIFFPLPCENQTLVHVLKALRRFADEVAQRHGGKSPILYGNCQAGWAAMLLAADCDQLTGPIVLNGSPLSYWSGASGVNPMRLAGGLMGGMWMTHLLADQGNGRLDGAWLVQNFESLNPAHTLWEKNYRLFSKVDTERERFIEFERWWSGFYFLSRQEILSIVENLFIGNKLERGKLQLSEGCTVDLTRIRSPLIIFASSEDEITPPHQALNWIPAVYPSTADLIKAGQRIVYLLNHHVGHLGLFVSADVAMLEHRAILESVDEVEALPPGLYEMKIINPTGDPDSHKPQYVIGFEERQVEQIQHTFPEKSFENVQRLSEQNEVYYQTFVSPWVRAFANPFSAEMLKWLHPMRVSRYLYSEALNPWMVPLKMMVPFVKANREPASKDNIFGNAERATSASIVAALQSYQQSRDAASERLFAKMYGE